MHGVPGGIIADVVVVVVLVGVDVWWSTQVFVFHRQRAIATNHCALPSKATHDRVELYIPRQRYVARRKSLHYDVKVGIPRYIAPLPPNIQHYHVKVVGLPLW